MSILLIKIMPANPVKIKKDASTVQAKLASNASLNISIKIRNAIFAVL